MDEKRAKAENEFRLNLAALEDEQVAVKQHDELLRRAAEKLSERGFEPKVCYSPHG